MCIPLLVQLDKSTPMVITPPLGSSRVDSETYKVTVTVDNEDMFRAALKWREDCRLEAIENQRAGKLRIDGTHAWYNILPLPEIFSQIKKHKKA